MKRIICVILVFVMVFGSINVFAEGTAPEYYTSVSGDIELNFNDGWELFIKPVIQYTYIPSGIANIQAYANISIKGNTDADTIFIESTVSPSVNKEIEIDSNGNFDQTVELVLASSKPAGIYTINSCAYINAIKGDKQVRVKIGKGDIEVGFLTNESIDINGNGTIDSLDIAAFNRQLQDIFMADTKMNNPESIKAYIYNEWYMKESVRDTEGTSFKALTHTKAKTDATDITLKLTNNGNTKEIEYLPGESGSIDEIEAVEGIVPIAQSHNVAAYASVKVSKGNREIELKNALRMVNSDIAIIGDIDGNKKINSIDFMYLRMYLMGLNDRFPVESGFYSADVDSSKSINSIDFALIRQYLLGIISEFPTPNDDVTPTPTIPTLTPTSTPSIPTPTSTPSTSSPTPSITTTVSPGPTAPGGYNTYYTVNGIDVEKNPGVEISVEKSPDNKIWVSAKSTCYGNFFADGYLKTYFTLSGSAVNGVDYELIDFDYFWRVLGSDLFIPSPDNSPRYGFYIIPIDTGTDETKDVEISFGTNIKSPPDAIIHLTKNTSTQGTNNN